MKKISKYLKVLLINFILFAYLTELLLFLLLPDTQKKLLKIQETRATIAKKLNRNYDLRSKELAFSQIKKNNPNLVPSFFCIASKSSFTPIFSIFFIILFNSLVLGFFK